VDRAGEAVERCTLKKGLNIAEVVRKSVLQCGRIYRQSAVVVNRYAQRREIGYGSCPRRGRVVVVQHREQIVLQAAHRGIGCQNAFAGSWCVGELSIESRDDVVV